MSTPLSVLKGMLGPARHNYIVPGLMSSKVNCHMVRVFENTREQEFFITPHNHRFDLFCVVLRGTVVNTLYQLVASRTPLGRADPFARVQYEKGVGASLRKPFTSGLYERYRNEYKAGCSYAMKANEFHSIHFSSDAIVLFVEGANAGDETTEVLLPVGSDRKVCDTSVTLPWMFAQ